MGQCLRCYHHKVIVRIHQVYLINTKQHQVAADSQSKLTNMGCKSTCKLLSFALTTVIYRHSFYHPTEGITSPQHTHSHTVVRLCSLFQGCVVCSVFHSEKVKVPILVIKLRGPELIPDSRQSACR